MDFKIVQPFRVFIIFVLLYLFLLLLTIFIFRSIFSWQGSNLLPLIVAFILDVIFSYFNYKSIKIKSEELKSCSDYEEKTLQEKADNIVLGKICLMFFGISFLELVLLEIFRFLQILKFLPSILASFFLFSPYILSSLLLLYLAVRNILKGNGYRLFIYFLVFLLSIPFLFYYTFSFR